MSASAVTEPAPAGAGDEAAPTDALGRRAQGIRLRFDALLSHLGAVWLTSIILVILAGVISRYAFNASFSWTEEAALWLFTYLIFTALPIATHRTKHIAMPMGTGLLSERGRAIVRMLSAAVVTYTVIRLLSAGLDFARITSGTSITLGVPSWWQFAIIPVSATLLLLYQLLSGLQVVAERRSAMAAIALAVVAWLLIDVVEVTDIRSGSPTLLLAIAFIVTVMMGVPVAYCMLFAGFVASDAGDLLPPPAVVHNVVGGYSQFLLLAMPLSVQNGVMRLARCWPR